MPEPDTRHRIPDATSVLERIVNCQLREGPRGPTSYTQPGHWAWTITRGESAIHWLNSRAARAADMPCPETMTFSISTLRSLRSSTISATAGTSALTPREKWMVNFGSAWRLAYQSRLPGLSEM